MTRNITNEVHGSRCGGSGLNVSKDETLNRDPRNRDACTVNSPILDLARTSNMKIHHCMAAFHGAFLPS